MMHYTGNFFFFGFKQETELLNTAALTGKREDYPLHVFAVSNENKLRDVSPYSDCFSTDTDVLRVSMLLKKKSFLILTLVGTC